MAAAAALLWGHRPHEAIVMGRSEEEAGSRADGAEKVMGGDGVGWEA
jgi:hypothetical protein